VLKLSDKGKRILESIESIYDIQPLQEAFLSGNMDKVVNTMASVLSKRLGQKSYISPIDFRDKDMVTYRVGIGDKVLDIKFNSNSSDYISKVSVYLRPSNISTYDIEFTKMDNIIYIVNTLEQALKGELSYGIA